MFHPLKIAAKIKAIEEAKKIKLVENSIEDCVVMYEHFKSMEDYSSNKPHYCRKGETPQQFKFTTKEAQWIENEMYMCSCSFPYWYYRYFFIHNKAKGGVIQRPDVLVAQLVYIAILANLDLLGKAILLLILKGRQLGISTINEAIILWMAIFIKGCHTVIASAEEDKTEEMANMVWVGLEYLPLFMQPVLTRDDRKLGPEFGEIHSDILLQHGSKAKGISRGDTPVACHLSEVAYYPNPIETIESSLIRAMHENPKTFLALESTAKKKGDWFHKTWLKNRKGEDTGYNRFVCLFLPWYVGHDKYPTKDWLLGHPIPKNWKPMKETLKQAADAKLYVATTPILKKFMGEWEMPIEQMWYWEFSYVEAREGGDETLKSFLAELASDERSCFQSKRWSVFSHDILTELEENKAKKIQYYAFAGDGIDQRFALEDFQSHSARRIDVSWQSIDGRSWHWKLIPLKEKPEDPTLDFFLQVVEHPKPGYKYSIGIDISSGQGQDRTVYFVNRTKEGEPDKCVCLFASAWILSPETPGFANCLGIYYGMYMPGGEALIAPEVQKAVGDFISGQLSKLGYINFYYMEREDIRRPAGFKPTRRGWVTTGWSQQYMMEAFEHAIKTGWIEIPFEDVITEIENLESFETDAGKVVYDHATGEKNDCYVAGGIAYVVSHSRETIIERMKSNLKPKKKSKEENDGAIKDSGVILMARRLQLEDKRDFPNAGGEGDGDPLAYVY